MLERNSPCVSTNLYISQMNVTFDIDIRFFTAVWNESVQQLQNMCSSIIAIVISYIDLKKNDTE
jgi:hypothetical protein